MYAQCPSCNTTFALSVEQLDARDGVVRCGRCFDVFNARWNLVDRQDEAEPAKRPTATTERPRINIEPSKAQERLDSRPSLDVSKPASVSPAPSPVPKRPAPAAGAATGTESNSGLVSMRTDVGSRADARASEDLSAAFGEGDVRPGRRMSDLDAATVSAPAADPDEQAVSPKAKPSRTAKKRKSQQRPPAEQPAPAPSEKPAFTPDRAVEAKSDPTRESSEQPRPEIDRTQFEDLSVPDVDSTPAHTASATPGSRWIWGAGLIGLLGLLAVQMRAFYLEDIAQRPALRPFGDAFCVVMSCKLPEAILIEKFLIEDTKIAFHPDAPAAIRISTSVRNSATVEQPYPDLQLTLTNKAGKIVGRRTFNPAQYLGPTFRSEKKLAPNSLTIIDLDLAEPAQSAIGFEVELVKRI